MFFPVTSVRNYLYSLLKKPEERSSYYLRVCHFIFGPYNGNSDFRDTLQYLQAGRQAGRQAMEQNTVKPISYFMHQQV
jgi:hypothetical protein